MTASVNNGSSLFTNKHSVKPHLLQETGGLAAEINDVRKDVSSALLPMFCLTVDEFIDPAAADADGIKKSIASAAAIAVYEGTALDGAVGSAVMVPPRNVTVTSSTHANIDAVAVAFEGTDINGDALTESITLTNGGGDTAKPGAKAFKTVTKITVPAQSGTGGALTFGFGLLLGLSKKLKIRAGASAVNSIYMENEAGTIKAVGAATGAYAVASVGLPNGTYSPLAPADAGKDYAIVYEYDPTA